MTDCTAIERMVFESIGFDAESTGRAVFERTVRAARSCRGDCASCAAELRDSPEALQSLIEELVVPETWFFRDREPFVYLTEAMRAPLNRKGRIRILSAPCSTGEEPYSAAMALLDAGFAAGSFRIAGVDISRRALEKARTARYGASSFRGWPASGHFRETGGVFQLEERVASLVEFREANLCDLSFLGDEEPYDAVFCRNLLIYLAPEARAVVIGNLRRLLAPEGVLFSGHAEVPAFLAGGFAAEPRAGAFACRVKPQPARQVERESLRRAEIPPPVTNPPVKDPPVATAPQADLLSLARAVADRGELEPASSLCDRVLRRNPADVEACFLKGVIERARGRLDSAEEWLRKTLYLAPGHYEALLHMSAIAESRGDAIQGALFLERARRAGPDGERRHA